MLGRPLTDLHKQAQVNKIMIKIGEVLIIEPEQEEVNKVVATKEVAEEVTKEEIIIIKEAVTTVQIIIQMALKHQE
jgi:virulence-associated protein VagC